MSKSIVSNLNHPARHQEYLDKMHRSFETPDELLKPYIEDALQTKVSAKDRIVKGESNEVYDVTLENKDHVIVRISRKEVDRFDRERWAFEQCQRVGVPVPSILAIGTLEYEENTLAVSIQTKLDGRSLRDMQQEEELSEERVKKILNEAGDSLGKMHSIETNGFGRIDGNGKGGYQTDAENISSHVQMHEFYVQAAEKNGIESNKVETALKILQDSQYEYHGTSRLQHADLGPDHVFVDTLDSFIGFIDFEGAAGGDPVRDLARWHYLYRRQLPLEWLLAGYPTDLIPTDFEARLHHHRIRNGLYMLKYYDAKQNPNGIRIVSENLDVDLEYFELL